MQRNAGLCALWAVVALVTLDQAVKLLIWNLAPAADLPLLGSFVRFHPYQNTSGSWFGSMGLPLFDNMLFLNLFSLGLLFFLVQTYRYLFGRLRLQSRGLQFAFWLVLAGACASLIDKVFWGGSLDYIQLTGLFIFDLKDVYISSFEVLALLSVIRYRGAVERFDMRAWLRYCLFLPMGV